jgi:tetratricopeptide (TPR) repeat protein
LAQSSSNRGSDEFAPKDFYLVDSLDLKDLSKIDRNLVDSCLHIYHKAKDDTSKINALNGICGSMMHDDWSKYQFLQYDIIEKALADQSSNFNQQRLLISLANALNNIGFIYRSKGNDSKALKYFDKSLKVSDKSGNKSTMSSTLNNIGRIYDDRGEYVKSLEYYTKSLNIAKELKDKDTAIYLNNIGLTYGNQGNYIKSLEYHLKSLEIMEKEGKDKRAISISLNNIATIYNSQGVIPKALEYHYKSLKLREEIGDKKGVAVSLSNIGLIYDNQGEIPKALELMNKSLKIKEEIGNKRDVAISLSNIGFIYKHQGNISKAIEYYHKSLNIFKSAGYKSHLATSLTNLGVVYNDQDELDEALNYFYKSLKISKEIGDKGSYANNLNRIGGIMFKKGKMQESHNYISRGLEISQEIGSPLLIGNAANLLSKIYRQQNKEVQAYEMYKLSIEMRDSINNNKNQKAIIKSQFKYEYEKQAAVALVKHAQVQQLKDIQISETNAKLKAKRLQQYFLIGGFFTALIIGFILFRFYQNKQKATLEISRKDYVIEKQRTIQQKLKALSSQMNPHFIFNSLNSIQNYITTNDIGKSELFLTKFAGLMRKTLANSEHTFIYLNKEIEALREYIELERLRLKNSFEFTINIEDNMEVDMIKIPTLLIQPYVENAICHRVASIKSGGKISITIKEEKDKLKCIIDDNGVERLKTKEFKNHIP